MMRLHAIPRVGNLPIDDKAYASDGDMLIALTCRPFRAEVVTATRVARAQGLGIVAITGSPASPLMRLADHGFVFVNLASEQAPMSDWYPGGRDELARFVPQIDTIPPLEGTETAEASSWKVAVETYSGGSHCSLNHPTLAAGVVRSEIDDIQPAPGDIPKTVTEGVGLESIPSASCARTLGGIEGLSEADPQLARLSWPCPSYHRRAEGPDPLRLVRLVNARVDP